MGELVTCSGCGGFMIPTADLCPHCEAGPSRLQRSRWRRVLGLAGCASLGLTMMACYGGPPCEPGTPACADPRASSGVTAPAPVAVAAAPQTEPGPARR